jgi:hypothetical protein
MATVLKVTKTAVTIPTIPGDLYPEEPNLYLYSCTQGKAFTIDLTFSLFDEDGETSTQIPISSISSSLTGYTGVTFTTQSSSPTAYVIRVSGTLSSIIADESYTFVLPTNDPTQGFPISTVSSVDDAPTNLAIVRWNTPALTYVWRNLVGVYNFTASGSGGASASLAMSQYVYWDWEKALNDFKILVANGEI